MKTKILAAVVLLASFGQGHAFVIGDEVLVGWLYPDQDTTFWESTALTVSDAVELPDIAGQGVLDLNISDSSPELAFDFINESTNTFTATAFNGFFISDVSNSIADFIGVNIDGTNLAGFDADRIFFNADTIYLNFTGIEFSSNAYIDFDIEFASTTSVPEPGTMLLFGLGLVGLVSVKSKKKFS